jgi:hypothetical protein
MIFSEMKNIMTKNLLLRTIAMRTLFPEIITFEEFIILYSYGSGT